MKTRLTCTMILLGIFLNLCIEAQCPTGNITLNSQEDVNNFPTGCTVIDGTLTIQGSDITDLSPLENITTIGKALKIIQNDALTNLDGLKNVTTVGAYLRINKNSKLTNLDGLKNLAIAGGYIEIVNNPELISLEGLRSLKKVESAFNILKNTKLTTLSGLDNIASIGRYLYIFENNQLTSLKGLGSLESIETGLKIQKNPNLTTLEGLDNLTSVGGNINILTNGKLINVNGLESLTSSGGFLKITLNPVLNSLRGLKNLSSIDGYIKIRKNNALTTLSGLEKIDPESITNLILTANGKLSFCHLPNICEYLSSGGKSNIKDNIGACASKGTIQSICESLVDISSVESLGDISVGCHTLFKDLGLPSTVEVTYSDNSKGNMNVIWQEPDYDETVGSHHLTGLLDLMGPIANPNNLTAQITVHVKDTLAPIPDITQLPELKGACSVSVSDIPTANDNCGGRIDATTNAPLLYNEQGTYTITWIYDDGNGNTSTQNQTVIVETNTIPVMDCPETYIVSCDPVITFDLPEARNNCGPVNIVQTDNTGLTSGSEFPVGTTRLTFQTTKSTEPASCSIDVEVLPKLELQHVAGIQNGDTLHIADCQPPDISQVDLDLGPHQSHSSIHRHIYSQQLPPKDERPAGLWKVLLYSYEVDDQCGHSETFEYYVYLYDLDPPVFQNFPRDTTINTPTDLPPVPHDVRTLDICRYVAWDTVITEPVWYPGTPDTLAFVRRWIAKDQAGNKSFRDQMIYISEKKEYGQITARIIKEEDIASPHFPGGDGTTGITVTLYRVDTDGITAVDSMQSGDWQGKEGSVFFTPLLQGAYRVHIEVPEGYVAIHPASVVDSLGWSDSLDITGDTMLNLGRIVLLRDSSAVDTMVVTEALVRDDTPLTESVNRKNLSIKAYPNPTTGWVKIGISQPVMKDSYRGSYGYRLYDRLGRTVRIGVLTDGLELDLSGQPGGLYYIRVHLGEELVKTVKVMVMGE